MGTAMQWGHDGTPQCNGATMGPHSAMGTQWDGTQLCAMGTAMQWGHDGTPKHNGAIMGWDPIVHYGDLHAMGT